MEKQKRWQFWTIIIVIVLTLYNVLPTIFFYSKPLKEPVSQERAMNVASQAVERVNDLADWDVEWLQVFTKNLGIKPQSITLRSGDTQYIDVDFSTEEDAALFKRYLNAGGVRISFIPAQLSLAKTEGQTVKSVTVRRQVADVISNGAEANYFKFTDKYAENGEITPLYQQLVFDRAAQVALAFMGPSPSGLELEAALSQGITKGSSDSILSLSKQIVEFHDLFKGEIALSQRYYSSFSQVDRADKKEFIQEFISRLGEQVKVVSEAEQAFETEQERLKKEGNFLSSAQLQEFKQLKMDKALLQSTRMIVEDYHADFAAGQTPKTFSQILKYLEEGHAGQDQEIDVRAYDAFVSAVAIDWNDSTLILKLQKELLQGSSDGEELHHYLSERLQQYVVKNIARVGQVCDEKLTPQGDEFVIDLNGLTNSQSLLVLNLAKFAEMRVTGIIKHIESSWHPEHSDLQKDVFNLTDAASYEKRAPSEKGLGLVVYAPVAIKDNTHPLLKNRSLYVVAKGLRNILQKYDAYPDSAESKVFLEDFQSLSKLLEQDGFFSYPGVAYGENSEFAEDYIFELNDYYDTYLTATRERFSVKGSQRFAVLEFTDVEERIITGNKINRSIHEDLLKWRDEYHAAQISHNVADKFIVPPPAQSAWWENVKLNMYQYFHGDDRRVIHWGQDLAGGKIVHVALKDQNNQLVTEKADLREGMNELSDRVNKMGVSEVNVHIEGDNIVLEFPSSQNISASDLVTGSTMTFHIVNETFSVYNKDLREDVTAFLQDVWNEAVVTNRQTVEDINEIAWKQLGGTTDDRAEVFPRTEHARVLYEHGLRLAGPDSKTSNTFDDTLSAIVITRGDNASQWHGQANPLMIAFNNYALEGTALEGVHSEFNPSRGNVLVFRVASSYPSKDHRQGNPQDDLYAWTSKFNEGKVVGTPLDIAGGKGWRMAVVLNNTVINAPHLGFALRTNGEISGGFSQREASQLAADLKAGSLSFAPQILSEQNISAELGHEERAKGISAAMLGLVLVVAMMIWYYRFSGVVASVAILFNLLIMWGVLQNLDAALTLPGIAGIILTIGMAVDANVLVFERIREEYAISQRLASAIQTGYRKAFSAIVDSNLTTILAAFILIHFDAGPIKGFAITLIIGIVSSMFTALFMTRYFFTGWVRKNKNSVLHMRNSIKGVNFNFLGKARKALTIAVILIVAGVFSFVSQKNSIFGMDFVGGYSLDFHIEEQVGLKKADYSNMLAQALISNGADEGDFEIRQLNQANHLQLHLSTAMDEEGQPFYQLPAQVSALEGMYPYESQPRLAWVVGAMLADKVPLSQEMLQDISTSWTTMSGQLSDSMRNQALYGLAVAIVFILIYLSFRFEFKYALGAIVCLLHDVLITMGFLAILKVLGLPFQIDLQTIGALMTIIGYSLNDTIIVFDRIREDSRLNRKQPFEEIVNQALNKTLSRTVLTSLTTLLVLLALALFGGSMIFEFALVMSLGVIFGTLSSLFIASPAMLYFHKREEKKAALSIS